MSAIVLRPNRRSGMMRVQNYNALLPSSLRDADVAATLLQCTTSNHGMTTPYELENSFLLTVQLETFSFGLWCRGRKMPSCSFAAGAVGIYEMDRPWLADMRTPFKVMHFHVPHAALDRIAQAMDARPVPTIRCPAYDGIIDPVLHGLASSLLPSFERQDEANRLFVDHVRLAIGAHTAARYGGMQPHTRIARGGLAPWQLRRVTEFISANLDGEFSLADLAAECEISTGHLIRAFRKSTGMPPHQWLLKERVAKAKQLLLRNDLTISEVSLACGFVDQSHLTRVFAREAGMPPGAWRRSRMH